MSTLFDFLSLAYLSLAYHKSETNCVDKTKKKWLCIQRRLRSAWASAYFDQSIHGLLHDKTIKETEQTLEINEIIFHVFSWLTILFQIILFEKTIISNNYDPDQSDCPDILSGLISVQTVFKGHYATLVGAVLNLQRQLLSDLNTVPNFENL